MVIIHMWTMTMITVVFWHVPLVLQMYNVMYNILYEQQLSKWAFVLCDYMSSC